MQRKGRQLQLTIAIRKALLPDLVIICSNTVQLVILPYGIPYHDGTDLHTTLSSHALRVYTVVCCVQEGKTWVSLPCMGNRRVALAEDDEIIFSHPGFCANQESGRKSPNKPTPRIHVKADSAKD
jgi:uncharacterized protein (DUF169 family)